MTRCLTCRSIATRSLRERARKCTSRSTRIALRERLRNLTSRPGNKTSSHVTWLTATASSACSTRPRAQNHVIAPSGQSLLLPAHFCSISRKWIYRNLYPGDLLPRGCLSGIGWVLTKRIMAWTMIIRRSSDRKPKKR